MSGSKNPKTGAAVLLPKTHNKRIHYNLATYHVSHPRNDLITHGIKQQSIHNIPSKTNPWDVATKPASGHTDPTKQDNRAFYWLRNLIPFTHTKKTI